MPAKRWPSVEFPAMGTDCLVMVEPGPRSSELMERGRSEISRLEDKFSRFRSRSELSRLNEAGGGVVSHEMGELLEVALGLESRTHGLFSVSVLEAMQALGYDRAFEEIARSGDLGDSGVGAGKAGERRNSAGPKACLEGGTLRIAKGFGLDLGGIAKGWSAQRVAGLLGEHGGALVDLGGDLYAAGPGPVDGSWPVALDHGAGDLCTLLVEGRAVCTSSTLKRRWFVGGDERNHIVDPGTGQPIVEDLVAVSVVGKSGAVAEAMAKAAIVGGVRRGLNLLGALEIDALATSADGVVYGVGELFAGVTETVTLSVRAGGPELGRSRTNSIVPAPSTAP